MTSLTLTCVKSELQEKLQVITDALTQDVEDEPRVIIEEHHHHDEQSCRIPCAQPLRLWSQSESCHLLRDAEEIFFALFVMIQGHVRLSLTQAKANFAQSSDSDFYAADD